MKLGALADIRQGMAMASRGAGSWAGDWELHVVDSADIAADRVSLEGLRAVEVRQSRRNIKHLLEPYDILVTARAQAVKVALVPPGAFRTVAAVTLLVVRTPDPGSGLAHFLWYYLSSGRGRAAIASRLTATSLPTLSAKALGEVPVPLRASGELWRMPDLVHAAEWSRETALEAVHLRHDVLRDAIIGEAVAREDE